MLEDEVLRSVHQEEIVVRREGMRSSQRNREWSFELRRETCDGEESLQLSKAVLC